MAPAQVCRTQFPGRLQGRRPSGKGRVKSAFQLPGKKGGGGGEREEEKQTRSVCRRHKAPYTKGAREGRRGLPGARLIPTPARGLGEECGPRIPPLRPAGKSLPHPGWVRSSAAAHPGGGGQGKPGQPGKAGLDVRGRYTLRRSRSDAHPIPAPEMLSAPPPYLRGRHKSPTPACTHLVRATPKRTTRPAACGCTGWATGGSYLSPAPGSAPAPRLPPPRSLQLPRSPSGTARRPRMAGSKSAPEGRQGRGRLGYKRSRHCIPIPGLLTGLLRLPWPQGA